MYYLYSPETIFDVNRHFCKEKRMSENEKDSKDFEFIKEQVIVNKRKKYKKWMFPFIMTALMAILFGIIAAITFCIAEPEFYQLLHKEEENKTPVNFPTEYPEDSNTDITGMPVDGNNEPTVGQIENTEPTPTPVIVEQSIEADIDDYQNMYGDIKAVAQEAEKSLVTVSSIINESDWIGNQVERKIETTGIVIGNNSADLLILVSLDRVKDTNSIKIELSDTVVVDAVIQDYESDINLAVLAVNLDDIPSTFMNTIQDVKFGESYTIAVGNPIIALGSPNGHPGSMETGIITSRSSYISITDNRLDLFNTDITNNKYSDGIIINMKGEVIGLITRTLKEDINEELSTAVGISRVKAIISLMANQDPKIYFGVITEDMNADAKLENEVENGIYVNDVQANSPAFSAGIKNGDILLQVDGQIISSTNFFYNIISSYQPGEEIQVKIKRTSTSTQKEIDLPVVLSIKEH